MINGIIQITGEPGVGKTSFALQCGAIPERVLFVDDDVKGRSTVDDLKLMGAEFGDYWDLTELGQGKTEYDLFHLVMGKIEEIKKGKFDVLVWDTWTNFASSIASEVEIHPAKYRKVYSDHGKFAAMQRKGGVTRGLETKILGHLAKLIPQIFLISHLRPSRIGDTVIPGQFEPASGPVLLTVPKTRFWLRRNPNGSPVPIALVLKGISKVEVKKGKGIRNINVLPLKLTPQNDERSLWDTIERYWNDPIDQRQPEPHEMPTADELAIINGMMTDDQKTIFHDLVKSGLLGGSDDEEENANMGVVEQAKAMQADGQAIPAIAKELDVKISEVKEMLK